jgi:hypothetical protein
LRALFGRFAIMEGEHMETLSRRYHVEAPDPSPAFRVELAAIYADVDYRPQDPDNLFRIAIALEKRAAASSRPARTRPALGRAAPVHRTPEPKSERTRTCWPLNTSAGARKPGLFSGDALVDAARAARFAGRRPRRSNAAALLLAVADPARIALVCGDQQLSYGDLRERWPARPGLACARAQAG